MTDRTQNVLKYSFFGLLLLWGIYGLFYYLGVPSHQSVLLDGAGRAAVEAACPANGVFCMGANALLPFISYTIARFGAFGGYTAISLLVLGVIAVMQYLRSNDFRISLTLTPLRILLGFVASVWLIFTFMTFSDNGDMPFNRLFEPVPQVYNTASPQALQALQASFAELQADGCLTEVGTTTNGARIFDMSRLCMQQSFFTRVLPQIIMLLFIAFTMLALGRALLRLLRIHLEKPLHEFVFSAGLGSCGLIVILWLAAIFSLYTQLMGWLLLIVIPVVLYRDSIYWIRSLRERQWTYEGKLWSGALIIGWLLISYLALNFLNVVRPFPIGWDDLGKYINQPRLLVSYGSFIPQLASFYWEYITSLGFLLFGYESIFGATLSMQINWMAGVLAILAVYAFARTYLGPNRGLLAALIYYSLPLVGHFSYADMKVDNAVFATGALAMLAVFLALFEGKEEEEGVEDIEEVEDDQEKAAKWKHALKLIVLAGIIGGFSFAMKPTSVMVLMALGTVLFGALVHWTAFVGTLSLAFVIYLMEGRLNLTEIATRVYGDESVLSKPVMLVALLVLGVGMTAYSAYYNRAAFKRTTVLAGVFIASFIASIAPWLLYNNVGYGNVVPRIVFTAPNHITPTFAIYGEEIEDIGQSMRSLPAELQVDPEQCVGTAKAEELDRYWGYGSGWSHYLTLPWRTVMNINSAGYYVTTMPALLLFPLLMLLPFFWTRKAKWLRWMFIATAFMLVQWVLFANGILWYGVGIFLGLAVGLEALVHHAPDRWGKILASILVALGVMVSFGMRIWQYETQRNLFEYALGKVSAEAMQERTIPHYDDIREIIEARIVEDPENPYVYRIGTFIPYFIPRNLEVLPIADHQLDWFKCLNQERDAMLTLRRMLALGFNSIIFDTNTQTIEQDVKGSLHQKVDQFVRFVNAPGLGLQIVINDPDNGVAFILLPREVPAVPAGE